ncbi:MAG TPA: FKBP-type peptidyl-prolyl cis-trans isomerase [Candidatus Hydrogenedentes bacterium]|nr:FKBP-type peptidyl-prolyl cis-trans isomerase [Candidatus Hydrogenedentota bacterium]
MTGIFVFVALTGVAVNGALAEDAEPEAKKVVLESEADRISYAIGMQMASSLVQNKVDVSVAALLAGMEDMLLDREPALNQEEMQVAMTALQTQMATKQEEIMREMQAEAGKNLEEANAFLTENAKKEGVVVLDSGLQYTVIEQGEGDPPDATSKVKVHYRGTLLDGEQFDSSYDRGEPATFGVNQVIQGWQEALQLMAPGAKWKLFIPPNLAYGEQGNARIPGNSVLVFDVELLEVL